ncbi:MAG: WbqC family protein [Candidatus Firestonebacteria bacterium]
MKLSAHQPQYIPWMGYFDKLAKSDIFVFLDNVQYKKREFQNRNKIRTKESFLWLTVPVLTKGKYEQLIRDVEIDNTENWRKNHFEAIRHNYGKAPFYSEHEEFIRNVYSKSWEKLAELNIYIIKYIMDYLELKVLLYRESELSIEGFKTERLVNICKKLKADIYLSGLGARDYIEEEKFSAASIKLEYQGFQHPVYPQVYGGFETNLSILDLLFNKGKESARMFKKR